MKKFSKNLMKAFALGAAFLMTAPLFVACSSDGDDSAVQTSTTKSSVLTLKIAPQQQATRATTDEEKAVKRVVVGIFGTDGTTKVVSTFEAAGIKSGNIVEVTTSSTLTTADHVLVAVNAPADKFSGTIANEAAFRAKQLDIQEALGSTADNGLPMFGHTETLVETKDNQSSTYDYEATVDVYHLISKVTLKSLTVNFEETALAGSTFTPEDLWLVNDAGILDFQNISSPLTGTPNYFDASDPLTASVFWHGDYSGAHEPNKSGFRYKSFLHVAGADSPADQAAGIAGVVGKQLYTMPNYLVDDQHVTMLVINGKLRRAGSTTDEQQWYPIVINYNNQTETAGIGEAKRVYPNYDYQINVTIKGLGEEPKHDDDDNPIITPLDRNTIGVTVTPQSFTEVTTDYVVK